jgi:hypothetical protein
MFINECPPMQQSPISGSKLRVVLENPHEDDQESFCPSHYLEPGEAKNKVWANRLPRNLCDKKQDLSASLTILSLEEALDGAEEAIEKGFEEQREIISSGRSVTSWNENASIHGSLPSLSSIVGNDASLSGGGASFSSNGSSVANIQIPGKGLASFLNSTKDEDKQDMCSSLASLTTAASLRNSKDEEKRIYFSTSQSTQSSLTMEEALSQGENLVNSRSSFENEADSTEEDSSSIPGSKSFQNLQTPSSGRSMTASLRSISMDSMPSLSSMKIENDSFTSAEVSSTQEDCFSLGSVATCSSHGSRISSASPIFTLSTRYHFAGKTLDSLTPSPIILNVTAPEQQKLRWNTAQDAAPSMMQRQMSPMVPKRKEAPEKQKLRRITAQDAAPSMMQRQMSPMVTKRKEAPEKQKLRRITAQDAAPSMMQRQMSPMVPKRTYTCGAPSLSNDLRPNLVARRLSPVPPRSSRSGSFDYQPPGLIQPTK